jgi:hypothetical protein
MRRRPGRAITHSGISALRRSTGTSSWSCARRRGPGFEAAYQDSQIIGLWRYDDHADGLIDSVMLTRRPDLAAWERTKLPQGARESEVRRTLSRRYDLCDATYVHTTTLLTASDRADDARWA